MFGDQYRQNTTVVEHFGRKPGRSSSANGPSSTLATPIPGTSIASPANRRWRFRLPP